MVGIITGPHILGWVSDSETAHHGILQAAKLNTAQALVLCVDDANVTLKILKTARQISRDIPILVRSRDESTIDVLLDAGADEVIPETLEAGTTLVTKLLLLLNKSPQIVYEQMKVFHSKRYPLPNGFFKED